MYTYRDFYFIIEIRFLFTENWNKYSSNCNRENSGNTLEQKRSQNTFYPLKQMCFQSVSHHNYGLVTDCECWGKSIYITTDCPPTYRLLRGHQVVEKVSTTRQMLARWCPIFKATEPNINNDFSPAGHSLVIEMSQLVNISFTEFTHFYSV